jgi:hypothetical protein
MTKPQLIEEVERLREIIGNPEVGIKRLLVEDGRIEGDFAAPPYAIKLMGEAMLAMLGDAPNYVSGKTPHELRREAEEELERLKAGVA